MFSNILTRSLILLALAMQEDIRAYTNLTFLDIGTYALIRIYG